ncbi:NUDIX domain-containing protein [Amycolatopsis albispora]|uniref:NUDIX domain-containing protein n=1 Tax=Amycolatopsis albispora TaxID=1804986 RepID=UPI002150441F|nr:NUDIX hydrolase [Amycolatopsis albispora]
MVGEPLLGEQPLRSRSCQDGTRGAAAGMLVDTVGRLLVVNPTYKFGWGLPGGVIEADESPLAACRRELREELGIEPALDGLAGVDWIPARLDRGAATIFVFAGRIPDALVHRIRLPPEELSAHLFADPARLDELLAVHIVRRMAACLAARRAGRVAYLEFGRDVLPSGRTAGSR